MKTIAVLVTYRPNLAQLEINLAAIARQVAGLVLVDNGSGQTPALEALLDTLPIPHNSLFQPTNLGLAQAQNAGIARAKDMGADAVLLMDQDSHAEPGMVAALMAGLEAQAEHRPAAIGTAYTEPARGADASLPPGDVPEMQALIASGTLIPTHMLETVGLFDEALFIDLVDTEWCFRARALGHPCFAARGAHMTHQIGDERIRVLGYDRPIHAPARAYYQIRNLLLLRQAPHIPRRWLWRKFWRTLVRSLGLALLVPPRFARLRSVALGLWHGLRGRGGPMS